MSITGGFTLALCGVLYLIWESARKGRRESENGPHAHFPDLLKYFSPIERAAVEKCLQNTLSLVTCFSSFKHGLSNVKTLLRPTCLQSCNKTIIPVYPKNSEKDASAIFARLQKKWKKKMPREKKSGGRNGKPYASRFSHRRAKSWKWPPSFWRGGRGCSFRTKCFFLLSIFFLSLSSLFQPRCA